MCAASASAVIFVVNFMVNIIFIVTLSTHQVSTSATATSDADPVIYVSFDRWENRTFSPRVYYLLLNQQRQNRNRNQNKTEEPEFPDSTAPDPSPQQLNSNQLDFFANRGNAPSRQKPTPKSLKPPVPVAIQFRDTLTDVGSGPLAFYSAESAQPQPLAKSPEPIEIDSYGLTFDIFRVSKDEWQDQNILFSPISFLNVMAMLLLGSNGTTFNELARHIKSSNPDTILEHEQKYHTSFQRLLNLLSSSSGPNVSLDIFNGIFVDKSYPLRSSYRQNALELYAAQTTSFDFGTQGEQFRTKVNELVSFKTQGKIPSVIDGPVDPTTTLALINTIYFRGNWEKPFIREITKKRRFVVDPTESMTVDMMTNVLTVPYLETPSFRVVGLPYKGNKTGFFILLPTEPGVQGLKDMESKLSPADFDALFTMKETPVTIQMPKMRVEGNNGEAKEMFKKLGLSSLFDAKRADLSRISNTSGLYIKSIVHKGVIEVDEVGTEAAAATIATGDRTFDDNPPIIFTVNRPYAFCILHIKARTIIFYGRVTRPSPLPLPTATSQAAT